ncbi:hypothetical protein UFOVP315_41 [uncultured Caudovirales phage]|uniref:Uncharacterized protein n=1 Tax=uncultured Caudovirales phage TaxID=2100421 RepID=A0A6J5LRP8_9CAUD|nr:hypothetical protein UFOVP315_41 [uncultured Caudovirales phage]
MSNKPTKVLRGGKIQTIREKDMQRGDITAQIVETERSIESSKAPPLPGTRRVKVLAIGPYTLHGVKVNNQWVRVPQWVVLDDGRALNFSRMFDADGTADVGQGEVIFPGGAVFVPCPKTAPMETAERESRNTLALNKMGLHVGSTAILH